MSNAPNEPSIQKLTIAAGSESENLGRVCERGGLGRLLQKHRLRCIGMKANEPGMDCMPRDVSLTGNLASRSWSTKIRGGPCCPDGLTLS